ncbi:hypothetical protein EXS72_02550 [Candidatus Pacearchaeota archaeon]|nr:hypothetical protein [Candidatus Pacearchaeota archaeon]
MIKKKRWKQATYYSILIILGIIIFLTILNYFLREEFYLNHEEKQALLEFFPEEHLNKINWYNGGVISWGASKIFFNNVYINPRTTPQFANRSSIESQSLLVHETMHTWQSRKGGYIKMDIEALYYQFISFLKYGSRNYAYIYSINQSIDSLNVEQEAELVDDYFSLKYETEEFYIRCIDCENLSIEEIIPIYDIKVKEIFARYD